MPVTRYAKAFHKLTLAQEMRGALNDLKMYTQSWQQSFVVRSNHDEHIERWLNDARIDQDPANAKLYHQLKWAQLENIEFTRQGVKTINSLEW